MLSLSRREGESIIIGDNVLIRVHSVKGNRVRLGIDAPRYLSVVRAELLSEFTDASVDESQIEVVEDESVQLLTSDVEVVRGNRVALLTTDRPLRFQ